MIIRTSLTSYDHDVLLQRARHYPRFTEATASAFTSWVFSLEHPDWNRESEKAIKVQYLARLHEKNIEEYCLWLFRVSGLNSSGEWRLEFADPLDGSVPPFLASVLTIDNKPLRCIPDVVLRNRLTNEVMIIERKVTFAKSDDIPTDGWPNLRAQLWCYRWIDNWSDCSKITLVGEIWQYEKSINETSISQSFKWWSHDDYNLNKQSQELFEAGGGSFVGPLEKCLKARK